MTRESIIDYNVILQVDKDPVTERIVTVFFGTILLQGLIFSLFYLIYDDNPPDWFVIFSVLGLILGSKLMLSATASKPSEIKVTNRHVIHTIKTIKWQRRYTIKRVAIKKIRIKRVLHSVYSEIVLDFLDKDGYSLLKIERWKSDVSVFSFSENEIDILFMCCL